MPSWIWVCRPARSITVIDSSVGKGRLDRLRRRQAISILAALVAGMVLFSLEGEESLAGKPHKIGHNLRPDLLVIGVMRLQERVEMLEALSTAVCPFKVGCYDAGSRMDLRAVLNRNKT